MPCLAHSIKSIWFVPIQNAPMLKSLFADLITYFDTFVLDLIPKIETSLILFISSYTPSWVKLLSLFYVKKIK